MSEKSWAAWPTCERCGRPRQTRCPVCHVAGNQFALAEYLAPSEPIHGSRSDSAAPNEPRQDPDAVTILLHCPQCDEAFVPEFYRRCPACGHNAGHGLEIRKWQPQQLSDREFLVILGLLLFGFGALVYFWTLFQQ